MGFVIHRPLYAVDYGDVETVGSGVVLGDNNDSTFKRYFENSGSVLVYPAFDDAVIPPGRSVIAVRAGHRQRNTGFAGLYNGWVCTFLRIGNNRQNVTKAYVQDGYIDGGRTITGKALYKKDLVPWTEADISAMSTDSGAAVGDIGPNGDNYWCVCSESFIYVVYDEPVPVPVISYPANGSTIATSSVDFKAVLPAPQAEQPVGCIFQVSRVPTFNDATVKTFVGGLNESTTAGSESKYNSEILKDTYTGLGPGTWYVRVKGRDYRGAAHESAWGATTSFQIVHGALPVPTLTAPQPGTTVPTPYGTRTAAFAVTPEGERQVGVTWQFARDNAFTSSVVTWTNRTGGIWLAPGSVSYNPQPTDKVGPGLDGPAVSLEDPSQRLGQGLWYARVRATDVYGQSGAWSSAYTFTVSHVPVAANAVPRADASFDQDAAPVTWTFTDPWVDDAQSAYRMRVLDATDNVLQDTGKLESVLPRAIMSIPWTRHREVLRHEVTVWDSDDVGSAAPLVSTFRLSHAPVITLIGSPTADEQIVSGQPTISWSAVFAVGSLTQKSFRVRYVRAATNVVEWDSTVIVGAATTYTPPRPILKNLTAYQLQLTVTDSENLSSTLLRNFSTNFERPDPIESYADADTYRDKGYVEIYFPNPPLDPFFFEFRIYRRPAGEDAFGQEYPWVLAGTVESPDELMYRDWLVAGAGEFEYSVTQAATRFGSIVESDQDETPFTVTIYSESYWLISPDDETLNIQLHRVNADDATERYETNEYVIKGRGRKRNIGTRIGWEGSLTVTVRATSNKSATQQIAEIRRIAADGRVVIMRDPFGNLTNISIGDISRKRLAGVGANEFADIDMPFFEVV